MVENLSYLTCDRRFIKSQIEGRTPCRRAVVHRRLFTGSFRSQILHVGLVRDGVKAKGAVKTEKRHRRIRENSTAHTAISQRRSQTKNKCVPFPKQSILLICFCIILHTNTFLVDNIHEKKSELIVYSYNNIAFKLDICKST